MNSSVVSLSEEEYRQLYRDPYDATREYAHLYRENGRFGSHPEHDNYDEESWPD